MTWLYWPSLTLSSPEPVQAQNRYDRCCRGLYYSSVVYQVWTGQRAEAPPVPGCDIYRSIQHGAAEQERGAVAAGKILQVIPHPVNIG